MLFHVKCPFKRALSSVTPRQIGVEKGREEWKVWSSGTLVEWNRHQDGLVLPFTGRLHRVWSLLFWLVSAGGGWVAFLLFLSNAFMNSNCDKCSGLPSVVHKNDLTRELGQLWTLTLMEWVQDGLQVLSHTHVWKKLQFPRGVKDDSRECVYYFSCCMWRGERCLHQCSPLWALARFQLSCVSSQGLMGFCLNAMTIVAFLKVRELRTPSNFLVFSLAMADIGISMNATVAAFSSYQRWMM